MPPFGEHQFFFVEIEFAFFGYINQIGPDEELQGLLSVITSGDHSLEYGLWFQSQLLNCYGIMRSDGVLLPESFDYLGDSPHNQPVGQEDDRQDKQYDHQDNEQYALRIHKQITPI